MAADPRKLPDVLTVGVVLKTTRGRASARSSRLRNFSPPAPLMEKAVAELQRLGFRISGRSPSTLSLTGPRDLFERTFATKLTVSPVDADDANRTGVPPGRFVVEPAPGAPIVVPTWLADVVAFVEIQSPVIRNWPPPAVPAAAGVADFTGASALPVAPPLKGDQIGVPEGICRLLKVEGVHDAGFKGAGVTVAMIDTGFAKAHPFYVAGGYSIRVIHADPTLGFGIKNDPDGHGTGEAANLLSVAPEVSFVGIKFCGDQPGDEEASLLAGFQRALALRNRPAVISCSLAVDKPWGALEAVLVDAFDAGIVVVGSAGNGECSFPAQHPSVIAVGGVFVPRAGSKRASNFASAYESDLYRGRSVPDVCGLVGEMPRSAYIMLPVPPGSRLDVGCSEVNDAGDAGDGTTGFDGWALFSGTSAAAPQVAGVCALMLQADKTLLPEVVKEILIEKATNVVTGSTHIDTGGIAATAAKVDVATGGGLVNAKAAWLKAKG